MSQSQHSLYGIGRSQQAACAAARVIGEALIHDERTYQVCEMGAYPDSDDAAASEWAINHIWTCAVVYHETCSDAIKG